MKNIFAALLITTFIPLFINGCKHEPEEILQETFRFRRNAVTSQVENLIYDIGETYTDRKAVKRHLETFIRQNPRVAKVSLYSLPLVKHPFAASVSESLRAAPNPINKYIAAKRFNLSPDMVWYRMLLRKKIPFWYQKDQKNAQFISYVKPIFKEYAPEVITYVIKFDYDRDTNPVLFWNVPKRFYTKELLKMEKVYLKKYILLRKKAEQREQQDETAKKLKSAKSFYKLEKQIIKQKAQERDELFKKQHPKKYKELQMLEIKELEEIEEIEELLE
jgi:hypothetical protein